MAVLKPTTPSTGIPEGYRALPLHKSQGVPTRLCVLVRQTPDPVTGSFVVLRDLHDALVYLGCVTDAGGRVREWIEVWVQNVDRLNASLPAERGSFSDHPLDESLRPQKHGIAGPRSDKV